MKAITITLLLLFSSALFAQSNSINYKALIRNADNTVAANTSVDIVFTVLRGVAQTSVYQEAHESITDANGIVFVNIGEGVVINGVYSNIDWATEVHFLNTQINIGDGLTDMGTTAFNAVPYALHAQSTEIGDNLGNHNAMQDLNLNNNKIIAAGDVTASTIFSTASNSTVNSAALTGSESIVIPGITSDYIVSVQDGNGRIQHKWNATHGTGETFIVGAEDAATINLKVDANNDNDAWIEFKHANGASSAAGDPINWNTQMIINQGGEVGINETSPDDMLHVTAAGNGTRIRAENSSNGWAGLLTKNTIGEIFVGLQGAFDANPGEFHIFDNVAGSRRLVINSAGDVGIGKNNPTVKLDVNGSVNCTGGTCSSDERWKEQIAELPNVIYNLKQMRGVSYYWKTEDFPGQNFSTDKQIGLIAQEVEKVYPELVKTDDLGYKSMDYMSLTAILLEGVKQQQEQIENLQAKVSEIDQLKALMHTMQSQLNAIKSNNKEVNAMSSETD